MPPDMRKHVRYPELLLQLQAAVYGLYHMTTPEVFYNREDLWTVASEVDPNAQREQATQTMEPNFVLMKLPGEARSSSSKSCRSRRRTGTTSSAGLPAAATTTHYGNAIVYDFPKTRLVDGPLQIEARIDQNPQLSGQLSLWNQQGSRVRRGALIVIPVGRALLYAEPIYLQAERSPMPELRLVVLALQDRLAYGPTFEVALAGLFGGAASTLTAAAPAPSAPNAPAPPVVSGRAPQRADHNELIARSRPGSRRLPAPDGRRKTRRGRAEARSAEAEARALARRSPR